MRISTISRQIPKEIQVNYSRVKVTLTPKQNIFVSHMTMQVLRI